MSENTIVDLRVRIDDEDDLAAAHAAAEDAETEVSIEEGSDDSGGLSPDIEPITCVLVGGAVMMTAKFLTDWWEKRRGGLVIDLRPEAKDQVARDKDVPWGLILVFPAQGGEVKIETKEQPKDATERLLGQIVSGAYDTVGTLAEIAAKTVGADKVQTGEPTGG